MFQDTRWSQKILNKSWQILARPKWKQRKVPRRRRRGTVLCFASLRPKWKQRTVPRRRRRGTFLCFAFMLASYVVRSEAVRCGDVVKCVSFSFTYKIASLLCALSSLEYKSSINLHVIFILSMIFHHFDPYRVPYMTPTQFFALSLNLLSNWHIFFILCMIFHHFDPL